MQNEIDYNIAKVIPGVLCNKRLPSVIKTPESIIAEFNEDILSPTVLMLISYSLSGMISSYLKEIHSSIINVFVISANTPASETLASCLIKTYTPLYCKPDSNADIKSVCLRHPPHHTTVYLRRLP